MEYTKLKFGDLILAGDEYFSCNRVWVPVKNKIGTKVVWGQRESLYRRQKMSFQTKYGKTFQRGDFFRKNGGTYVYMVTEVSSSNRAGKGVSFNGVSTSFEHSYTYTVCEYDLFVSQVMRFHTLGSKPDAYTYPVSSIGEQDKPVPHTKSKLQDLIEAVECIPDLLRLAKSCMKVKKLLDEDTELV